MIALARRLSQPWLRPMLRLVRPVAGAPAVSAAPDGAGGAARTVFDVQALAESLARDQRARGHAVACSGRVAPLPATPPALQRCLANLVDNAVRHGGSAQLTLCDDADSLRVEVRDAGPGIAEERLQQLLQTFSGAQDSLDHSGGPGSGLAIASAIAHQHGGTLVLHNALPSGLVATLTLPR